MKFRNKPKSVLVEDTTTNSTIKKMKQIALFVFLCLALASYANAYEVVESEDGQEFYLVPVVHRQRRQVKWDVSKNGPGVRGTVGYQGTILDNGAHRLDGNAFASKNFRPSSATTVGGGLGYSHIPSGSNLNVNAAHTGRGGGTDLGVQGTGNLWRKGNSRLDAVGSYDRHYGGLGGTGKPNYYGGLQFNHRF